MVELKDKLAAAAAGERSLGFDPLGGDEGRFAQVAIDDLEPDTTQARQDMGDLEELTASIQNQGLLSPLIVEPLENRRFRVIAGNRRYHACRAAGLKLVPTIIRTFEAQQRLEVQLVENLHRKDLNPVEEAVSYQRLMDEFNLSQNAVAKRVGKARTTINETLRILTLPEEVLEGCRTSDTPLPRSLLLEIAKEPDGGKQLKLWNKAQRGLLTVREARLKPDKPKATKPATYSIKTSGATVSIRFRGGAASAPERIAALEEALEKARSEAEILS